MHLLRVEIFFATFLLSQLLIQCDPENKLDIEFRSICYDSLLYRNPLTGQACEGHKNTICENWVYVGLTSMQMYSLLENCPKSCGLCSRDEEDLADNANDMDEDYEKMKKMLNHTYPGVSNSKHSGQGVNDGSKNLVEAHATSTFFKSEAHTSSLNTEIFELPLQNTSQNFLPHVKTIDRSNISNLSTSTLYSMEGPEHEVFGNQSRPNLPIGITNLTFVQNKDNYFLNKTITHISQLLNNSEKSENFYPPSNKSKAFHGIGQSFFRLPEYNNTPIYNTSFTGESSHMSGFTLYQDFNVSHLKSEIVSLPNITYHFFPYFSNISDNRNNSLDLSLNTSSKLVKASIDSELVNTHNSSRNYSIFFSLNDTIGLRSENISNNSLFHKLAPSSIKSYHGNQTFSSNYSDFSGISSASSSELNFSVSPSERIIFPTPTPSSVSTPTVQISLDPSHLPTNMKTTFTSSSYVITSKEPLAVNPTIAPSDSYLRSKSMNPVLATLDHATTVTVTNLSIAILSPKPMDESNVLDWERATNNYYEHYYNSKNSFNRRGLYDGRDILLNFTVRTDFHFQVFGRLQTDDASDDRVRVFYQQTFKYMDSEFISPTQLIENALSTEEKRDLYLRTIRVEEEKNGNDYFQYVKHISPVSMNSFTSSSEGYQYPTESSKNENLIVITLAAIVGAVVVFSLIFLSLHCMFMEEKPSVGFVHHVSSQDDKSVPPFVVIGNPFETRQLCHTTETVQSNNSFSGLSSNIIDLSIPAGFIGVVIEYVAESSLPVVVGIEHSSCLADQIQVGDKILSVNEIDVQGKSIRHILKMIRKNEKYPGRRLKIYRKGVHPSFSLSADNMKSLRSKEQISAHTGSYQEEKVISSSLLRSHVKSKSRDNNSTSSLNAHAPTNALSSKMHFFKDTPKAKPQQYEWRKLEVLVPPGNLGVGITESKQGIKIVNIESESSWVTKIKVGDIVVAVDSVDVVNRNVHDISRLLEERKDCRRRLTIIRKEPIISHV